MSKKNQKEDRSKHLSSVEKTRKTICEKCNIDHKAALIAAKMHDKGSIAQEHDPIK